MTEVTFTAPPAGPSAPVATETPTDQTPPQNQEVSKASTPEVPPTAPAPAAPEVPKENAPAPTEEQAAAEKVAEAAGFDLAPFSQEFTKTGDVSADNRSAIAKGLEKVLGPDAAKYVDAYIEGQKAVQANSTAVFMEAAGGESLYDAMTNWAARSWSPAEIAAYDSAVESGNQAAALLAVRGLKAQYEASYGRSANLVTPSGGAPVVVGYKSTAEMTADMAKPEYKKDPSFRAQVAAKLRSSNFGR